MTYVLLYNYPYDLVDITNIFYEITNRSKNDGIFYYRMNLLTIIPIAKAIGKETLTYFSSERPEIGSVVSIPLRNKKIAGIVIGTEMAELKKTEIKNLSYGIKKMDKISAKQFLLPEFIDACKEISDYYATTTGAVMQALIPKALLESVETLTKKETDSSEIYTAKKIHIAGEVVALQASPEERYSTYKSMIREEFAKKSSIFLILPSREEIKIAEETLQKGIEQYAFVLHNGLSKKEIIDVWKKIMTTEHPVLIIATGYFLCIPRTDIHTVILENESSRAYAQPTRPYVDIRTVAEIICKKMGWRIVFGATCLRIETIWREKENEISAPSALKYRVVSYAECTVIDNRSGKNQTKKEFEMISPELGKIIEYTKEKNDNLLLFCSRKGLSPLTICSDCGETVVCENCGASVVLYGRPPEKNTGNTSPNNFFLCHRCGTKQPADILCKRCNSWKLVPLGVGIESAEKEIRKKFPNNTLFVMDKDRIKTHVQAEKITKKFLETPGSILLATEMALPYIKQPIGYAGVVSLDSFFSIPDWRITEKIMGIILSLRTIAERNVLIQTRKPEEKIFDYASKGNLSDFYRDEIDERKKLGFPPFNTFIKITLQGNKTETRATMEKLREDLKPYDLNIFSAFHSGADKKYTVHGLLILPRGDWPKNDLLVKLRALSPAFTIKIDPDSVL